MGKDKIEIKIKEVITDEVEAQMYTILQNKLSELHYALDKELDGIIKKCADKVYEAYLEAKKQTTTKDKLLDGDSV